MNKCKSFIPFILILGLFIITEKVGFLSLSPITNNVNSNLFNIITVNSVFAGFLFTTITFFVGVSSTKTIKTLERIEYMENIYNNLFIGFISSIISIILSVISIFIIPQLLKFNSIKNSTVLVYTLNKLMPILILSFLGNTILSFILALKHLKLIIQSIRRKLMIDAPSKESIEKTIKEIK